MTKLDEVLVEFTARLARDFGSGNVVLPEVQVAPSLYNILRGQVRCQSNIAEGDLCIYSGAQQLPVAITSAAELSLAQALRSGRPFRRRKSAEWLRRYDFGNAEYVVPAHLHDSAVRTGHYIFLMPADVLANDWVLRPADEAVPVRPSAYWAAVKKVRNEDKGFNSLAVELGIQEEQ